MLEKTQHVIEEDSFCAIRNGVNRETVTMWVTQQGGDKRRETADYVRNDDVSGDFPGYSLQTQRYAATGAFHLSHQPILNK